MTKQKNTNNGIPKKIKKSDTLKNTQVRYSLLSGKPLKRVCETVNVL
jgi:hypothetical protein